MKKILTGIALLTSAAFFGQNTFPSFGNVRIGTDGISDKYNLMIETGWAPRLGFTITDKTENAVIEYIDSNGGQLRFQHWENKSNWVKTVMSIGVSSGNVGIGTNNPDALLTVNGKIHCEEVQVDLDVAPDYVFQKYYTGTSTLNESYTMPTLEEVEAYTKENNHLPSIPSAQTIKEEGLHLKEMTSLLLQKIEELTLYTIEQEKRIKALEKEVATEK